MFIYLSIYLSIYLYLDIYYIYVNIYIYNIYIYIYNDKSNIIQNTLFAQTFAQQNMKTTEIWNKINIKTDKVNVV